MIASVGAPEKIAGVQALGADAVFCYRETPVGEAVRAATGGRGVDAVIDSTGGPLFGDHVAAMAPDGRLVTCGAHAGEVVPLDLVRCSGEATGCSGSGSRAPTRSVPP